MKKLMAKLEDIMVAITFAESGEYEEAIKLSGGTPKRSEHADELPAGLKQVPLENTGK